MEIWIPLIYPIIVGLASYFIKRFRHKIVWWEPMIPLAVALIFIGTYRFFVIKAMTDDTEIWGGYVNKVEYYEAWDERVPCSHPKYCTRTVSDGKGGTKTQTYQCGWQHAYDVDYHPPHWNITDNNGITDGISQQKYNSLAQQFRQTPKFVDLGRDYHSIDGDKYQFFWQGERETYEPMITKHTYENRVQAAHSIYEYPEVDEKEVKQFGLYDYPDITNRQMNFILGAKDSKASDELLYQNCMLGKPKQLVIWVLVFKDKIPSTGQMQERYWKGGNKNEFIICIGVNGDNNVDWCHTFSWSESQEPKITIRDFVMHQKKLDLLPIVDFASSELEQKFKRKPFKEFSYLTVEPPGWAILWCHIITLVLTLGITTWNILNEFDESGNRKYQRFRRW